MYRFSILILFQFFLAGFIKAQELGDSSLITQTDSLIVKDSALHIDSPIIKNIRDSIVQEIKSDSTVEKKISGEVFFDNKKNEGKEVLFYAIIVLLLLFAFLNRLFSKYYSDLYRLFFRTTLHQSQLREQMIQSPLPSLLLNIFFVITGGLYLCFLFQHYEVNPIDNFWLLFLFCSISLTGIYLIKFLHLKFSGWLFNVSEAADSYIFIVFVINKMIGVFLLPIIVILAFTGEKIYNVGINISYIGIGAFIIYRIILTFASVRNQVRVNLFHFILYVFAFEIIPLLIIYKLLLLILQITT